MSEHGAAEPVGERARPDRLRDALTNLTPYVRHDSNCRAEDACICGMRKALGEMQKLLTQFVRAADTRGGQKDGMEAGFDRAKADLAAAGLLSGEPRTEPSSEETIQAILTKLWPVAFVRKDGAAYLDGIQAFAAELRGSASGKGETAHG